MSEKQMTRTAQREKVMQAIYQLLFDIDNNIDYDATLIINQVFNLKEFDDVPNYAKHLYVLALDNFDEIKKLISDNLVSWDYSRVDSILKAILFVAISEGNYVKDAPRNVVINEAIKLAKSYGSKDDYKFINSILDKVLIK